MNKSEERSEEPQDLLSELPDSTIFEILGLLPMRDVVRTTILSKRWNNLWTTTPYLNFDSYDSKFINRALILWRRFKILRFKINVYNGADLDTDLWVRLAKENGVQELHFENKNKNHSVCVPQSLYSCSSLKVLSLKGSCRLLGIYGKVQWNQLKSLRIDGCIVDDHVISQVFHGSPQLEVFILNTLCNGNTFDLSIRSSSLKKLSIVRTASYGYYSSTELRIWSPNLQTLVINKYSVNLVFSDNPQLEVCSFNLWNNDKNLSIRSTSLKKLSIKRVLSGWKSKPFADTELRIKSPNLETLDIVGDPYGKYSLEDVSSLTHLTLNLVGLPYGQYSRDNDDFFGDKLGQIFPSIQHVEKLTVSDWCIKVLGAMKEKYMLSPLMSNLKLLTINMSEACEDMVYLLQFFPQLKTIVLNSTCSRWWPPLPYATSLLQAERNLPESFLMQLKTLEITCIVDQDDDLIFSFIEILLKRASMLQKMTIRVTRIHPSIPSCLEQKVLRMPRSSPTAELIFAEY